MPHSIIERPAAFCMSKNEIRYVFFITNSTRSGLYLEVQLFYRRSDASSDSSFPSFKLVPNSNGKIILTVQQYIDGLLDYDLPSDRTLIKAATKQSVSFWIVSREVDDSSPTGAEWINSENTHKRIGLKMGVEVNRYSRNNLLNYIETNKYFLTWQGTKRKVFTTQPLFLSFLLTTGNTTNIALDIAYKTKEGTVGGNTITLSALTGYIYHVAVDINSCALTIPTGENLVYWEIRIINTSTFQTIINAYRFYKDYKPIYNFYDFIYVNSLGGIDTARAAGETTLSIERTFDIAEGGFNAENWNSTIKASATKQVNINLQRKWKGDLGFRQDKIEQLGLMDLLLCLRSYMILDNKWLPLLNIQTSVEVHKTTDTKWSFPIEWQLAETNESYTPESVVLGIGNDTEVYYGTFSMKNNLEYYAYISSIDGIDGFSFTTDLKATTPYYCEWLGHHTNALNVNSIVIHLGSFGSLPAGHFANILINGELIQTLEITTTTITFTTTKAILITDIIEIVLI